MKPFVRFAPQSFNRALNETTQQGRMIANLPPVVAPNMAGGHKLWLPSATVFARAFAQILPHLRQLPAED